MKKIVILGAKLTPGQKARLEKIGSVSYLTSPKSSDELVKQANGADVLYSDGAFLLESLSKLENIFCYLSLCRTWNI
ncbi:MAG: hypothetical protein WC495_00680 [Patescibacteria group bacterium]|jgi:hypothetical protein